MRLGTGVAVLLLMLSPPAQALRLMPTTPLLGDDTPGLRLGVEVSSGSGEGVRPARGGELLGLGLLTMACGGLLVYLGLDMRSDEALGEAGVSFLGPVVLVLGIVTGVLGLVVVGTGGLMCLAAALPPIRAAVDDLRRERPVATTRLLALRF